MFCKEVAFSCGDPSYKIITCQLLLQLPILRDICDTSFLILTKCIQKNLNDCCVFVSCFANLDFCLELNIIINIPSMLFCFWFQFSSNFSRGILGNDTRALLINVRNSLKWKKSLHHTPSCSLVPPLKPLLKVSRRPAVVHKKKKNIRIN